MPFVAPLVGIASIGLGVAGMAAQSKAASASAAAGVVDREAAFQATIIEYDKLDINIGQRVRQAGVVVGAANAAIAGAGAEVSSGVGAQARAVTMSALARDIEVLQLNADIAATRLGFGPSTGGIERELEIREKQKATGILISQRMGLLPFEGASGTKQVPRDR